jgi:hypothetical protein
MEIALHWLEDRCSQEKVMDRRVGDMLPRVEILFVEKEASVTDHQTRKRDSMNWIELAYHSLPHSVPL